MRMMVSAARITIFAAVMGVLLLLPAIGAEEEKSDSLNGYAEVGYRYRNDGDDTDQDVTEALSLDYFRPWKRFGEGAEAGFVFYGLLQQDLDDRPEDGKFDPFRESADTYKDSSTGWLYLSYGELSTYGLIKTVRIGRQESSTLEPVAFDGGLLTVKAHRKLYLTAFGGIPVNLFEESGDRKNESIAGAYLDLRLKRHLSFILGYLNLRDEVELLNGREKNLDENLLVAQAAWRVTRTANLLGKLTFLEDELRDATVRGSYRNYDRDLRISAYYYHLFITREAETLTEDPFSILLGDYEPYHQGRLNVYKGLGEYFGVEGGTVLRELLDPDDESTYNHAYQRYLLSLFIYKTPFGGSEWTLGADLWSAPGDVYNESYRGEYSQKLGKRGKIQAGTAYYLFKIDELSGTEDEEVQVYYAGITIPTSQNTTLRVDYSFEDGSLRDVDSLKARFKYEF